MIYGIEVCQISTLNSNYTLNCVLLKTTVQISGFIYANFTSNSTMLQKFSPCLDAGKHSPMENNYNMLPSILWIFSTLFWMEILTWRMYTGWSRYKELFKWPHIEKFDGEKSRKWNAHSTSIHRLITRFSKCPKSQAMFRLEVWEVAPSCWNYTLLLSMPLRSSSLQNLFNT